MSSKATIFLTEDNEHCYEECNDPVYKDGKFAGYKIVLELDKRNINILLNDNEGLVIEVHNPESEVYKQLMLLKGRKG